MISLNSVLLALHFLLLRHSLSQFHLLAAEHLSFINHNSKAKAAYVVASARLSGFIHEQGLACELAGHHCKTVYLHSTWSFFGQNKQCCTLWGSPMKVHSVTRRLDSLSESSPGVSPSLSTLSSSLGPVGSNRASLGGDTPSSRANGVSVESDNELTVNGKAPRRSW